jgi:hypothetical protein
MLILFDLGLRPELLTYRPINIQPASSGLIAVGSL